MKKITFLCLSIFLASCSQNVEWQDLSISEINKISNELESGTNSDYELILKGYSLEELSKEKDETTPTTQKETSAEPWLIQAIQDSLTAASDHHYGRTRSDASAYATNPQMVGVFKFGNSCRNYRDFTYFMDCEDGGDSHVNGFIGDTFVDGNRNAVFKFCLVPAGNYGGGTLLLYNYTWSTSEGNVDVVARYHDNEDKNNKNGIQDNGGLSTTGLSTFGANTNLFWRFSEKPAQYLSLAYGVLSNTGPRPAPYVTNMIHIDDENGKNSNDATLWMYRVKQIQPGTPLIGQTTTRKLAYEETFRGINVDRNTNYYIEAH